MNRQRQQTDSDPPSDTKQQERIRRLIDEAPRGYRIGISHRSDTAASRVSMTREEAEQFVETFNQLMDGTEFSAFWEPCLMLDSIELRALFGQEVAECFVRSEREE